MSQAARWTRFLAAGQADIDVKKAPPQGMLVAAAEVGREKASNPAVRPLTRDHDDPASDRSGRHER